MLFHAGIVYALVAGLVKKVVDVVRAPVKTQVIEEIKKPPPPEIGFCRNRRVLVRSADEV